MNHERVCELLDRTVDIIPEKDIQGYVRNAFDVAHPEFFQAPSSSTGKYHTPENNLIGGLTGVHTIKTAFFGHDFAAHSCPEYKGPVIAACLLHDIRKGVKPDGEWGGYAREHALLGYEWLMQFDLQEPNKEIIRQGVRTHMTDLSFPKEEKLLALNPNLPLTQRIVQYADQAASLMWASFIPGFDVRSTFGFQTNDPEKALDELMNLENLEKAIDYLWKSRW